MEARRKFYGIDWVPLEERIYEKGHDHRRSTQAGIAWFRIEGREVDPACGVVDCVTPAHQRSRAVPYGKG